MELLYVIRILAADYFVLSQSTRLSNWRTDGRTDGQTEVRQQYISQSHGKSVMLNSFVRSYVFRIHFPKHSRTKQENDNTYASTESHGDSAVWQWQAAVEDTVQKVQDKLPLWYVTRAVLCELRAACRNDSSDIHYTIFTHAAVIYLHNHRAVIHTVRLSTVAV